MNEEEFIENNKIRVCFRRLPGTVRAFCTSYDDGYTVVINESLSPEEKRKALKHELRHIDNGDLFNNRYQEYG